MKNLLISLISVILTISISHAAKVSSVQVDMVKGFTKSVEENGDTSYYYMGRIVYHFLAEGNDSIFTDFTIVNTTTGTPLEILEKTGDVGIIKQRNADDTVKIIFFKTKITGDISGEYKAEIKADANMSHLWHMADSLVQLMTNEQKQSMLYVSMTHPVYKYFGQDDFTLGDGSTIVGWRCADGPHGLRYPIGASNEIAIYGAGDTVTLFPTEASLGCSWDTDLVYRVGKAIAQEFRAYGVYCNLGPMCDLVINPRWGRAFETMGEDPYHVGKMAASQVKGLQSEKVLATPKHFAPYVTETERMSAQVVVEERALRELFCTPFRMCIQEGKAGAIMTNYHRVQVPGFTEVPSRDIYIERAGSNRHTINTILRHDWGFDGIIMTDWNGAEWVGTKYAYETEFDMNMPEGKDGFTQIADKISNGLWDESYLNRKATRIMHGKLWAWDGKVITSDQQIETYSKDVILSQEHLDVSLEAARKGIVLAKNNPVDAAPILPIGKDQTLTIAVTGPYANTPRSGGGGSSAVTPDKIITPLQGIQALAASHPNLTITDAVDGADIAIVCVGVDQESEDHDRPSMVLPNNPVNQNDLVASVMAKVPRTVVVYTGGSASCAGAWSEAPGVVIAFYPGRFQGQAIAEVLFGDVNPGGHLNVTFPSQISDLPSYEQNEYFSLKLSSVDTAHGYFRFEKTGKTPLFWFGHGLSYTTFSYDAIRLGTTGSILAGDRIDVFVTVTNTGTVAGDDVVQLYVKPIGGSIPRRVKDLRRFARISLAPGESKQVPFSLVPHDFAVYQPDPATKTGHWIAIPGQYEILAGSTSDPAVLTGDNSMSVKTTITVN